MGKDISFLEAIEEYVAHADENPIPNFMRITRSKVSAICRVVLWQFTDDFTIDGFYVEEQLRDKRIRGITCKQVFDVDPSRWVKYINFGEKSLQAMQAVLAHQGYKRQVEPTPQQVISASEETIKGYHRRMQEIKGQIPQFEGMISSALKEMYPLGTLVNIYSEAVSCQGHVVDHGVGLDWNCVRIKPLGDVAEGLWHYTLLEVDDDE